MDEGRSDILAAISDLRAKAGEHLKGNEYFLIVQQLDALSNSPELTGDLARSIMGSIEARLAAEASAGDASQTAAPIATETAPEAVSAAMAGDPEIPEPPDTPAQPDSPSTPEEPAVPDTPVKPQPATTPDIPSPQPSPSGPPTPPENPASTMADEPEQIISPAANSFSAPQATVALNMAGFEGEDAAAPDEMQAEPADEAAADSSSSSQEAPQSGMHAALEAARQLVTANATGNDYYKAANLLGELSDLLRVDKISEAFTPPGDLDGVFAFFREETDKLLGAAQAKGTQLIADLERLVTPKPAVEIATDAPAAPEAPCAAGGTAAAASEPKAGEAESAEVIPEPSRVETEELAEVNAQEIAPAGAEAESEGVAPAQGQSQKTEGEQVQAQESQAQQPDPEETAEPADIDLSTAPDPEPDAGPSTGFDELAGASWQRVKEVDKADRTLTSQMNGSAPPQIIAEAGSPPAREDAPLAAEAAQPAPVSEPMAQDKGEAFTDGGAERRSSEPCFAGEFETTLSSLAATGSPQPAGEAAGEQAAEASGKTPVAAEAQGVEGEGAGPASESPVENAANVIEVQQAESVAATDSASDATGETIEDQAPVETPQEPLEAVAEESVGDAASEAAPEDASTEQSEPETAAEPDSPAAVKTATVVELAATGDTGAATADQPEIKEESVSVEASSAEPAPNQGAPEGVSAEPAPINAETEPVKDSSEPAASAIEPGQTAADIMAAANKPEAAATETASPVSEQKEEAAPETIAGSSARRGFFNRLFGGRSAEHG